MKYLLALFPMFFGFSAQAGDVVTDQGLTPKCEALAQAYFAQKDGAAANPVKLVDIYVVDISKPETPNVNSRVQVEQYLSGTTSLFTTKDEVTLLNPQGACYVTLAL